MSEFSTELLFIAFLIAMNNILAMTEAALLAVRKARLQQRVNEGDKMLVSCSNWLRIPTSSYP
jgi:CBS domain containing-hemolysin-like protein